MVVSGDLAYSVAPAVCSSNNGGVRSNGIRPLHVAPGSRRGFVYEMVDRFEFPVWLFRPRSKVRPGHEVHETDSSADRGIEPTEALRRPLDVIGGRPNSRRRPAQPKKRGNRDSSFGVVNHGCVCHESPPPCKPTTTLVEGTQLALRRLGVLMSIDVLSGKDL